MVFATAPLPHAEHRPVLGEVVGLILLPLTRHIPPWRPAPDQRHQPRLLPTLRPPAGCRGAPLGEQGGASSERQRLNNSGELSKRNRSCCLLGRGGALGRARSRSLSSPLSPVSLCHAASRPHLHQPYEQGAGGPARAPRGPGPQEHPSTHPHQPALVSGAGLGLCRGTGWGRGVPSTHVAPSGCHMPEPSSSWDRGLPPRSSESPPCGETPLGGGGVVNPPSPSHRRHFAFPSLPSRSRAAVPRHNGPFLPRYRCRLRRLGPFPSAELPRQHPRQKNSSLLKKKKKKIHPRSRQRQGRGQPCRDGV